MLAEALGLHGLCRFRCFSSCTVIVLRKDLSLCHVCSLSGLAFLKKMANNHQRFKEDPACLLFAGLLLDEVGPFKSG